MTFWTSSDDEAGTEDLAAWLASIGADGADGGWDTTSSETTGASLMPPPSAPTEVEADTLADEPPGPSAEGDGADTGAGGGGYGFVAGGLGGAATGFGERDRDSESESEPHTGFGTSGFGAGDYGAGERGFGAGDSGYGDSGEETAS
jgi:hypothetical protein